MITVMPLPLQLSIRIESTTNLLASCFQGWLAQMTIVTTHKSHGNFAAGQRDICSITDSQLHRVHRADLRSEMRRRSISKRPT